MKEQKVIMIVEYLNFLQRYKNYKQKYKIQIKHPNIYIQIYTYKYIQKMGNKLCCDVAIKKQSSTNAIQISEKQLQQFMEMYPSIRSICKNPSQIYNPVDKTQIMYYTIGVYIGRSIEDHRNGLGIMLYKDYGIYYEGQWKDDVFNGRGYMANKKGDLYDGEWKNGLPHGRGVYLNSENNWRYDGLWEYGSQNGKGEEIFDDGSRFVGTFKDGLRNGKGKYKTFSGEFYDGEFVNGKMEGHGVLVMEEYNYDGQWNKGNITGTGKSQWFNDKKQLTSEYIGEYKQGEKQGFGQYRDIHGLAYKGKWQNGQMTNQGIFVKTQKTDR